MNRSQFGTPTLTFLVIANMIGAGVFTTSGFSIGTLKSPFLVILAWVIGGILALCGAISYGQLTRVIPESGGEFVFLSRAAHPLLGFIAGCVSLIAGFTGAIAFAATAFERYLVPNPSEGFPTGLIAISVVVFGVCCHGLNSKAGAMMQNMAVCLKLTFLVVFLGLAFSVQSDELWKNDFLQIQSSDQIWAVAGAVVWISLSYMGFNAAVYLAEEADEPARTVPRALVYGTLIVFVMYVLLNVVFVCAPSIEDIENQPDIAAVAARSIGGYRFESFVRYLIAGALFTSVTSMMMAAPRVYAKMAADGFLPRILNTSENIPLAAMIVQAILASAIVVSSTLSEQLNYLSLTLSISAMCSVCCLFLPKVRRSRPFSISDIPPMIYVMGTLVSATLFVYREPMQIVGTLITFLIGGGLYFITRRSNESGH